MKSKAKIDKKEFYKQLIGYQNKFRRDLPIRLYLDIENTDYKILIEENRNTTMKFDGNFVIQIYNKYVRGMHRYLCDDIYINLYKENIRTDYQFYKFIEKIVEKILEEKGEI